MNSNSPKFAFQLKAFELHYGSQLAVCGEEVSIPTGVVVAVVGPNGAGKSSLIKALSSLKPLTTGSGEILNMPLPLTTRLQKIKISYLAQEHHLDPTFPITAFEVALMGCYGRLGWLRRPRATDREAATQALQTMGVLALKNKLFGSLSGGERQRVLLARALLQQSDLYLMDEPLNGVDAKSTAQIVQTWQQLKREGKTIVAVHHDLSTLQSYFDYVIIINRQILGAGPLTSPLTPTLTTALKTAYKMHSLNPALAQHSPIDL